MDFRRRDLLSAEARFLADFCGEDAVRRWRAQLSNAERNQLAPVFDVMDELRRALFGGVRRIVQGVLAALAAMLQPVFRTLSAFHAWLTGRSTWTFGSQAS